MSYTNTNINDQIELLLTKAEKSEFSIKFRIYQALAYILKKENIELNDLSYRELEDICYDVLKREMTNSLTDSELNTEHIHFEKDKVITELPARINWGGGWSDTIPYCIEKGGTVLNASIKVGGKYPIRVIVKKIDEKKIRFKSVDLKCEDEYSDKNWLLDLSDKEDPFLIHKGALIVTGIINNSSESLEQLLDRIGGGISISSSVNIPKGSGLGTSSIFSCACVKALYEIFGIEYDENILCSRVLLLEQLIGCGGGWQDQIGAMTTGIKLIKSQPGIVQNVTVDYVNIPSEAYEELEERFVLVYSGQQRLAKNILREIMNKYIISDTQTIQILYEIQRLAVLMKFELEKGNISEFTNLLNKHWELSKQLDGGATNMYIDQIFEACDDLIDGKFICGAGGGGFVQMILKSGVSKDMLRERFNYVFHDSVVEVWDYEFI